MVPRRIPSSTISVPPLRSIHSRRWSRYSRLNWPEATSCGSISKPAIDSAAAASTCATLGRARTRSSQPASADPGGGGRGEIAPAEGLAVEPRPPGELALEPRVRAAHLLGGAREQPRGKLARRALEDADLVDGPVDRLVVGVAELLDHAHACTRGRPAREQRRLGPAILDVLEDDRRVEDRRVAVEERGHLEPRARGRKGRVAAEEIRKPRLEGDALLEERDLHLLRVGGQRVLVEDDRHARS